MGVVLVVVVAGAGVMIRSEAKGQGAHAVALQEESEKYRVKMKEAYAKRADLLKEWLTKSKMVAKDKNFNEQSLVNALEETKVNPIKSQVDFDRFDWVQNDISNQAASVVGLIMKSNDKSSDGMGRVRELERVEHEIILARQSYHHAAFEYNSIAQGTHSLVAKMLLSLKPVPVFKAEQVIEKENKK